MKTINGKKLEELLKNVNPEYTIKWAFRRVVDHCDYVMNNAGSEDTRSGSIYTLFKHIGEAALNRLDISWADLSAADTLVHMIRTSIKLINIGFVDNGYNHGVAIVDDTTPAGEVKQFIQLLCDVYEDCLKLRLFESEAMMWEEYVASGIDVMCFAGIVRDTFWSDITLHELKLVSNRFYRDNKIEETA